MENKLNKDKMIIIVDNRESLPYKFKDELTITKKLETGDYSLFQYEDNITIERKSGLDFIGSITHGRTRFKQYLERMKAYQRAYIIVEEPLNSLFDGLKIQKGGKGRAGIRPQVKQAIGMHPNSLFGTIVSILVRYNIPIIFARDRKEAEQFTLGILKKYYQLKKLGELEE